MGFTAPSGDLGTLADRARDLLGEGLRSGDSTPFVAILACPEVTTYRMVRKLPEASNVRGMHTLQVFMLW